MKIHELTNSLTTSKKRLGRGIGSGTGKTAGRGTKGQNARSGGRRKPGFEGGQTKLAQRLPKARGFKAINPQIVQVVNIADLVKLTTATIDAEVLYKARKIASTKLPVKLLGNGAINTKLTVTVSSASASAIAKIEKAGGTVKVDQPKIKPASKKSTIITK